MTGTSTTIIIIILHHRSNQHHQQHDKPSGINSDVAGASQDSNTKVGMRYYIMLADVGVRHKLSHMVLSSICKLLSMKRLRHSFDVKNSNVCEGDKSRHAWPRQTERATCPPMFDRRYQEDGYPRVPCAINLLDLALRWALVGTT